MKNLLSNHKIYSFFLLLTTLILAAFIPVVKEKSFIYLGFLLLNFFACTWNRNLFDSKVAVTARTLLGLLFIFSGFVKGVDPMGTQYVIHDYLQAYGLNRLTFLDLPASLFLCALEFVVGFMLLLNIKIRFTACLAALMMLFFTLTTWYDAVANPVPDCGCFGKAIVLTNWQTFYKNIVLDALVIILLFSATRFRHKFSSGVEYCIIALFFLCFIGFEIYNLRNLPVINFLEWKEGKKMAVDNPKPIEYYFVYKNKNGGEIKEFAADKLPKDADFYSTWEYVDRKEVDSNPKTTEISFFDEIGTDVTASILSYKGSQILVVAYDLEKTDVKAFEKIKGWYQKAEENNVRIILLTAQDADQARKFLESKGLEMEYYFSDDTSLKGMIRSNPGAIYIKNSVIEKMWAAKDIPVAENIKF